MLHRPLVLVLGVLVAHLSLSAPLALAASTAPVPAERGMVVSASGLASEVGVDILRAGGNAVDAAVATGFALAVTYPGAGNIGGGGFLVAHLSDGTEFTLDFRETAPAAARRDLFLDQNAEVDRRRALYSSQASGVPGSVDGLLRVWEDHGSGKITREQLLKPAIQLAEKGFPISHELAAALNHTAERFLEDPAAAKIFVRKGNRAWRAGDRLVQTDLARTLKRILEKGRSGFYEGPVAQRLAKQMKRSEGLITRADLSAYRAVYREPVRGRFRDTQILSIGPPSSGGVLLVHMLNMLQRYPLEDYRWNSSRYIHLLTEVQRRAYADRSEHLGDPDFWKVPMEMLLSREYAAKRSADISMLAATPSSQVSASVAPPPEHPETTHYSVADAGGGAVSVTTTLNGGFGSGIVAAGSGFLLNNEMDDFSAKPGEPNLYGLVGNMANAIEPGKRMLSSMTPTIVLKSGKPFLVTGSPGGSTIITTTMQVILNVIVHGMDVQQAVSAPRHHSQWQPDVIAAEPYTFSEDTRDALARLGHANILERAAMGQANSIAITSQGIFGAPDPRGENVAAGY